MKRRISVSVLLFLFFTQNVPAEDHPNLWILSGQSNACGRAPLPGPDPDSRVQMYDMQSGKLIVAQDPLPGMNTVGTGPWVAAAQEVARRDIRVSLVGSASGGREIAYWHPGQPGHENLMAVIKQAGQGAGVFLWYQGESDSVSGLTLEGYVDELEQLASRVRQAADNPEMLAVIVQLATLTKPRRSGFTTIREAQRQFVLRDKNAILVPALGQPLGDIVHLTNKGYRDLGREIGQALLKVRYDHGEIDWPGPVLDAAVIQDDSLHVVGHFAEVEQLKGCEPSDFAVLDEEGTVRCTHCDVGNTVVTLEFEREIRRPSKLVYAFGQNPKGALVDEAGFRALAVQLSIAQGAVPRDKPTRAPNGAGRGAE